MCGIIPASFGISAKPEGHGYTLSRVDRPNPFFAVGTELKGHEFRYTKVIEWEGNYSSMVFETVRGKGFVNRRDGICYKNMLATYSHVHALGAPGWAPALVEAADRFREKRSYL